MDAFYDRLILRAATIDEVLSDDFETLPGQKTDVEQAGRRLATWCISSASGDWSLFERRLKRDELTIGHVLQRFASIRRRASAPVPSWICDAVWVEAALHSSAQDDDLAVKTDGAELCAFQHLFAPVVKQAEELLWAGADASLRMNLSESARSCLRLSLLKDLSILCAPALYERFDRVRKQSTGQSVNSPDTKSAATYWRFVGEMKAGGFRSLFEDKPVLLRLIALTTRQWIDTSREFVHRLNEDLVVIFEKILHGQKYSRVAQVESDLADPHNGGRSVRIVIFEDGSRVVYKPKDLRLDYSWLTWIERLNQDSPPIELKVPRVIVRDGYGWTEFIEHVGCVDLECCERFFARAGAWLALFHCFATTDMHQENLIAAGDHTVPIDFETILQAAVEAAGDRDVNSEAFDTAMKIIADSVMTVGLLPTHGRSPDNQVFSVGGLTADWNFKTKLTWNHPNSDAMRPVKLKEEGKETPNLPHIDGRYEKVGAHVDSVVSGFANYAKFLAKRSTGADRGKPLDAFLGIPVRKVIRATRFYYMLLQRLKNHKSMDDGVCWSAQADFTARLADWEKESDPEWPLQRAERRALLSLNVPHFVSSSDGHEISDINGIVGYSTGAPGVERARSRLIALDDEEIEWQVTVVRENLRSSSKSATSSKEGGAVRAEPSAYSNVEGFTAQADKIADELSRYAIRKGAGAAWIGLDWVGDAEVFQLGPLGPDFYNGVSGIAVFLAAHGAVTGRQSSNELALAGLTHLRKDLVGPSAARTARSMGIGGANGLGSIVYALTLIAKFLQRKDLLADAQIATELFTEDLVAADKQLDIIGGSAGAILCLLRLFRDTQSDDVLKKATMCGEHLLRQTRVGLEGRRSWSGQGSGDHGLTGMSHGAAGYSYALDCLAAATGREDFLEAATECVAFENSKYDAEHNNWPDLRIEGKLAWSCQWCHGAGGIGLARIGTQKRGAGSINHVVEDDIRKAVLSVDRSWRGEVDTLCCGALGNIEFLCEAGGALGRTDLKEAASQRLIAVLNAEHAAGDFRWNGGTRRFNLGLFRGLAGVGYTSLRRTHSSLPNVLMWE